MLELGNEEKKNNEKLATMLRKYIWKNSSLSDLTTKYTFEKLKHKNNAASFLSLAELKIILRKI